MRYHPGDNDDRNPGGFKDFLRRLVALDNPFLASLPIYRAWGITVRIHLLFILFILVELAIAAGQGGWGGLKYMSLSMGALFGIVLLHEYGHCIACRRVGGEASDILLWPLGGLASCSPPHTWRANFITTAGGPLVNVVLMPILGGALLAMGGGWDALIFNPFSPGAALASLQFGSWWQVAVWSIYYTNLVLLAFNVLVPMFPLDGGRLVQALLWARMGYRRSMLIAVNVGFIGAVVLALYATIDRGASILLGVAIFGVIVCYQERQRLKYMEEPDEPSPWAASLRPEPRAQRAGPTAPEQRAVDQARRDQEELDRILGKIKTAGMSSLSRREKRFLARDTERRRSG